MTKPKLTQAHCLILCAILTDLLLEAAKLEIGGQKDRFGLGSVLTVEEATRLAWLEAMAAALRSLVALAGCVCDGCASDDGMGAPPALGSSL